MEVAKNKELRAKAREALAEYGYLKVFGVLALTSIGYFLLIFAYVISMFCIVGSDFESLSGGSMAAFVISIILFSLVINVFMIGVFSYFVNIVRGLPAGFGDIFNGFRRGFVTNALLPIGITVAFIPAFAVSLASIAMISADLNTALTIAGCILFVIGLVMFFILGIKYSLACYIAADTTNQKYGLIQIIRLSSKMTKGFKGKIFCMIAFFAVYSFLLDLIFRLLLVLCIAIFDEASVGAIITMAIVYILYLAAIFVLSVYSMASIATQYVALNDKYFNIKPEQPETLIDPLSEFNEEVPVTADENITE